MNMKLHNKLVRRNNSPDKICTHLSFEDSILLIGFTKFLNKFRSFRINQQCFQLLRNFAP